MLTDLFDYSDTTMKNPNYVSAEPHIRSIELRNDDRFLLLACDGLWDKITYAESVELVRMEERQDNGRENKRKHMFSSLLFYSYRLHLALDSLFTFLFSFLFSGSEMARPGQICCRDLGRASERIPYSRIVG